MPATSFRIGLTGNIGSGKTTVARQFERLGIPVYYADARAKSIMVEDDSVIAAVIDLFGPEAYVGFQSSQLNEAVAGKPANNSVRQLNRAYVSERVFGHPEELEKLNAIVHPAVAHDALRWHQEQVSAPYTLHEAAISFETGGHREMDAMIVVTAPTELRLKRVITRDDSAASDVKARMDRQWSEEKKVAAADYLIYSDGVQLLMPQVIKVHTAIMNSIGNT